MSWPAFVVLVLSASAAAVACMAAIAGALA
jgi:hypothetical protein